MNNTHAFGGGGGGGGSFNGRQSASSSAAAAAAAAAANEIVSLISYAQHNYETNPTEALSALLQAMTLNSGKESADRALDRLRNELGDDIASHVGNNHQRKQQAIQVVRELLADESTILYEQGLQHILQQTMEDGSSVVCTKCNAVVSSARWQQHQSFWCEEATAMDDEDS